MLDDSRGIVNGFARVPNYCLRDKRLTTGDKGVYAYICSNASNFKCSIKQMARNLGVGKTTVEKSIERLLKLGYIRQVQLRKSKGEFGQAIYIAYSYPEVEDPAQEKEIRETENQDTDNNVNGKSDHIIILRINNIIETTLKGITPNELTSDQRLFERKVMRRDLTLSEAAIWHRWKKEGVDPYLILRAYVDTEYKRGKQTLQDIDNTLKTWSDNGAKTYKDVENYLLNKMLENITIKARSNPYSTEDEIAANIGKTQAGFISGWRDDMSNAYRYHQYDDLGYMLNDCPEEVFRYLSNDILEYAADYYKRKGNLDKRTTCLSYVEGGRAYA